mmetsp:Transcript_9913/g.9779  ORF Transcript_9913/g.9779 Transcript_9913/m.9779 type:complete len:359 (-) Transcript_9913:2712-3788(-)
MVFAESPEVRGVGVDGRHEQEIEEDSNGDGADDVHEADGEGEDGAADPEVSEQEDPVEALYDREERVEDVDEAVPKARKQRRHHHQEDGQTSAACDEEGGEGHVVDLQGHTGLRLQVRFIGLGAREHTLILVEVEFSAGGSAVADETLVGAMALAEHADGVAPGAHVGLIVIEGPQPARVHTGLIQVIDHVLAEVGGAGHAGFCGADTRPADLFTALALHGGLVDEVLVAVHAVAESLVVLQTAPFDGVEDWVLTPKVAGEAVFGVGGAGLALGVAGGGRALALPGLGVLQEAAVAVEHALPVLEEVLAGAPEALVEARAVAAAAGLVALVALQPLLIEVVAPPTTIHARVVLQDRIR